MSKPLVSIVMPMFNVEEYVSAAIDSVKKQTFENWELLIIDDGSTDDSNLIAQKYTQTDHRIKLFCKKNGGLSDARNFGLERASGEYVHFFDSDDIIQPDFYEKLLSAIIGNKYDFVICGYFKDVENLDGSINSYPFYYDLIDSQKINENQFFEFYDYLFNYAWNKIFKTSFRKNNGLLFENGLSIIEDKEFMSKVINFNPVFLIINYIGYRYQLRNRVTLNNKFTSDFVKTHLMGLEIQNKIFIHFCDNSVLLNQQRGKLAIHTAMWIFNSILKSSNNKKTKMNYIKLVVNNKFVNHFSKFYVSKSIKELLLRLLIRNKSFRLIYYLYKYRK